MSHKDPQPLEPWRAVLREGDPARAEPGFDPREAERMRRAVLAARPEPRRRFVMTPVWASALAAAALVLTVGVVRTIREAPSTSTVAVHAPRPAPVAPAPPAARPAPPAVQEPDPPTAVAELVVPVARPAGPPPAPQPKPEDRMAQAVLEPELPEPDLASDPGLLEGPAAEEILASADADHGALPRQVQFSTPGGTRIIWMLEPEESSTEESHE